MYCVFFVAVAVVRTDDSQAVFLCSPIFPYTSWRGGRGALSSRESSRRTCARSSGGSMRIL